MKFKSQLVTQVSGSIGGTTFSHNRGGLYQRARAIPTDPATALQTTLRGIFTSLVNNWTDVLTPGQRDQWTVYATNTPVIDKLGDPITLTGQQMYIRSNTPRVQAADASVQTGPVIFNLGDFTPPTFAATAAANTVDVTFTDTDAWANEDDSDMLVYISRPQNPSINFFKGPYQFAAKIEGDGITPPVTPAVIAAPFPLAVGQRVFVKVSVTRVDGRLSTPFRQFATAS